QTCPGPSGRRSAPRGRRSRRTRRGWSRRRGRAFSLVHSRKADDEARPAAPVVAVLDLDPPVMPFHDRLGDGESEARMAAEIVRPPNGMKAVKNDFTRFGWNPR